MKKLPLIISCFLLWIGQANAQVAITTNGSAADSSAMLDVKSTTKGLLIPRLNLLQRKAINLPATGLMVYQTDALSSGFYYYDGDSWQWLGGSNLTGSGNAGRVTFWTGTKSLASNDHLFWDNTNLRLGIGTTSPGESLSIYNGNIELKNNSLTSNEFRFHEPGFSGGNNFTAFKARSQAGDVTYTLPSADGSNNQVLVTNGSGALSWLTTELPLTIANGINRTGNTVKLGGNLTENTTITQDGSEIFTLTNAGVGNTVLNLSSSGDFMIEDNGNPFFMATSGGRIGIGSTNPLQKLTVDGTLGILEGGTTPIYHTIFQGGVQTGNIAYTLPVDNGNSGEVLSTDGAGILSWNAAESPLAFSNGLTRTGNAVKLGGTLTGNTLLTQGSNLFTITNDGTANTNFNLTGTGDFRIENNGAAFFTATDGGNIGVGIADPGQKLTVNGSLGIMESSIPPVYSTILQGGNQLADITYTLPLNDGNDGQVLTTNGTGDLSWNTPVSGSGYPTRVAFWAGSKLLSSNSDLYWDNINFRLGLGTATPNQQLELTGNLRMPATTANTGILYAGASPFMHNLGTQSAFLGKLAGNLTQSGAEDNIGIGDSTLRSITSGDRNVALGTSVLRSLTSADGNTVIGYDAGLNTNSSYNTFVGYRAGKHNTTDRSTFFGCEAGFNNTTGQYNTFIGVGAGYGNTIGANSVAVGYKALYTFNGEGGTSIGFDNTAIGYKALYLCNQGTDLMDGIRNVAVGKEALSNMTTGAHNTAVGISSGTGLTTGRQNIFIGDFATTDNGVTGYSVGIGSEALVSGTGCLSLGYSSISDGEGCTALGTNSMALGTNSTVIGYNAINTASNKVVIGSVLVTSIGGFAPWTNFSDRRLKENIIYRNEPGLDFIMRLKPASYNYINDEKKRHRDGLIAQDVLATIKETGIQFGGLVVDDDKDSTLNLGYAEFVIPLINAIQEQQKIIEKQKALITDLTVKTNGQQSALIEQKSAIAELKSQVEMLLKDHETILLYKDLQTSAMEKTPENKTVVKQKY